MIAPSSDTLLRVWEENQHAHPTVRALNVLACAWPEGSRGAWSTASIGQRDGSLLILLERLFGGSVRTTASCPKCGVRLESDFDVQDIRSDAAVLPAPDETLHAQHRGYDVAYRLPTSDDVLQVIAEAAAPRCGKTDRGARPDRDFDSASRLLARCVSRVRRDDDELDAASLPDDVIAAVAADMARNDPDADVRIALECPACSTTWETRFDIVSYFWGELDDWAQRLLADVHTLARAYGWSERAILALSPARRGIYLDMVGA